MEQWLTCPEAARSLGITERSVRRLGDQCRIPRRPAGKGFEYYVAPPKPSHADAASIERGAAAVARAPEYSRQHACRYITLLAKCRDLVGSELIDWVAKHNAANPRDQTSATSIIRARKLLAEHGIEGLLAQWGRNRGATAVRDDWYAYFRACYMKERGPSPRFCWQQTLGFATESEPDLDAEQFPSASAFVRRLITQEGRPAIDLARNGRKLWLNNHSFYIKRDWSNVLAGQVWVGDHHQLDVCAELPNGDLVYPWLSAWADAKSGRLVGWEMRGDDPDTDSILMSFHRAGRENPLCSLAQIDNGKDYRSRSVSGGLRRFRFDLDTPRVQSMFEMLKIEVHFALPYNARAKVIERMFRTLKQWLSASMPGYRGGNAAERPAELKDTIAARGVLPIGELYKVVSQYVSEVANRTAVTSGHRAGRCPDEVWQAEIGQAMESGVVRSVGADALAMCCTRVTKPVTVRNARIRDAELDVWYFDDALFGLEGAKVYLRRDPYHYETAWVCDASDNTVICSAELLPAVPGIVVADLEREQLREMIALQRKHGRLLRDAARPGMEIAAAAKMAHAAAGAAALNKARGWAPTTVDTSGAAAVLTGMEGVKEVERKRKMVGRHDLRELAPYDPRDGRGTYDLVNGYVPAASAG